MNKKLKKGDRVAIISPSATIRDNLEAEILLKNGEKILTDFGLQVVYGKYASEKLYYKSGSVDERISDIEWAFKDPKIKAIFCTQGGDNSNDLLQFLDWNVIKNNPKFFFGLSDITVLLNAMYKNTGQTCYYGLDIMWGLGKNATEYTIKNLKDLLFANSLSYKRHPDYPRWKVVRPGSTTGIYLGGCLPSFCLLLGTQNDPLKTISRPFILIIESVDESFSRIESYITQISQQPNFKKYCRGIIIGYFFLCKEEIPENNRSVGDIVLEHTREYDFPIIEIKELGHAVENLLFPIGGNVAIKAHYVEVEIIARTNLKSDIITA